ncbi:MAG: hypothetical protein ACPG5B_10295 [Chitinophagales bacterium]
MNKKTKTTYPCMSIQQIVLYVNKTISDNELKTLDKHIDNCDLCAEAIDGALMFSDLEDLTEKNIKKRMANISNKLPFLEEMSFAKNTTTNKTYTLDELLAMFAVVPHYEPLLTEVHRSVASLGAVSMKIIAPENGADCLNTITFRLNKTAIDNFEIHIENNQEETVIETFFPEGKDTYTVDIQQLQVGCYYWKMIIEDESLAIGKFYIKKAMMPNDLKNT